MKATAAAARLNQASRRLAAMGFLNPCNTFFERFADRRPVAPSRFLKQ
jgi:hypothetical protein